MDPSDLKRLKEEELLAVQQTSEQIKQWEKYKSDYVALKDRMRTLPDKLSHDVMVPFGSLAFMPGKLVDTNEVMVLLGDNWFADRAAKQACEIVDRRLEAVNSTIKDLNAQKQLLESRLEFTSELKDEAEAKDGVVDITEEYDPEKEKLWREQHRKNVQAHRKQTASQRENDIGTAHSEGREVDVWAKLEELELKERTGHEMSRLDQPSPPEKEMKVEDPSKSSHIELSKSVSWEDERRDSTESDISDDDDSDDDDSDVMCRKITFHHSPREEEDNAQGRGGGDDSKAINSPRDIYQQFHQPTSILKPSSTKKHVQFVNEEPRSDFVKEESPKNTREKVIVSGSQTAFTGSIVEREVSNVAPISVEAPQPRRISKFKRQQNARR